MIPDPNALKSPIFHLQQFLRTIAQVFSEISLVVPDGVYGSQTAQSVTDFQQMAGLPQTGSADFDTWNAIVSTYDEVIALTAPAEAIRGYPSPSYTISMGEQSDTVYFIQVMLNTLARAYQNIYPVMVSGSFDEATAASVRTFQPCCGETCTGTVNKFTWDMLVEAYEGCIGCCQ